MKTEIIVFLLDTRTGDRRKLDNLSHVYLESRGELKGIQSHLKVVYEIRITEE